MLIACGAMLWAFDMQARVGVNGVKMSIDAEACTPYLISMPEVQPVAFVARSEKRAGEIMENWQTALEGRRAEMRG
jgi:hypothetical protein